MTTQIGYYRTGHGFLRAYWRNCQIGSTATRSDADRQEWLAQMTAECKRREGAANVTESFGAFYRHD